MARRGQTWRTYSRLIDWLAAHYGVAHTACPDSHQQDEELLARLVDDLSNGLVDFQVVADAAGISEKHFRHHLRYIARWGVNRRKLLAGGGNFQLLEKLKVEDEQLSGLELGGTLPEQRRRLALHIEDQGPVPEGQGWLAPNLQTRRTPRMYTTQDVAWIYGDREVEFPEGLHPGVARSLIAHYLPKVGVVADPMAGSGTIAVVATHLGHKAWASDKTPARPFIRKLDLLEEDLADHLQVNDTTKADLLFLHPPLPATLDLVADGYEQSEEGYIEWLDAILENTITGLAGGAHLILVLPLGISTTLLARIETLLTDSLPLKLTNPEDEKLPPIKARHLAVARSGREGWHLLVVQSPPLPEEPRNETDD